MRTILLLLLLASLCCANLQAQETFPSDGQKDADAVYHLFRGAIVHQSPGNTDSCDVLVYRGKIISCTPSGASTMPDNTVIHEMAGKHLFPSFIEMNSSYGIEPLNKRKNNPGPEFDRQFNKALYWNEAIRPETEAVSRFTPNETEASAYRKMGFGYTLSQLADGISRGSSVLTSTGDGVANNNVIKSEGAMHYSLRKGSSVQDYPSSMMGAIALLRQSYYDAQWYEGSDIKETNFSLEAINEKKDLPQIFVAENKYDINRISRIAVEFGISYTVIGGGDSYQLGKDFAPGINAVIAPLNMPQPVDMSDPDLGKFVNQSDLLHWDRAPFNPFYLQSMEVELMLSANGIKKPKDFFAALQKTVGVGLDADTAFAALTTTPAALLGVSDRIGKIESGYLANFFVATGDVFTDSDVEILTHWISGKPYVYKDPNTIDLVGDYTLNVDDKYFVLNVKKTSQFTGTVLFINEQDTSIFKADISQLGREVSLQFSDTIHGIFRLSGTIISDNRIWDGLGTDASGKQIVWSAIRRVNGNEKPKPAAADTATIPIPPTYKYPFNAYGFDSIPKAETVLLTNATVWTNDSIGILKNASVLIGNGEILAVGKNIDPNEFLSKKEKGNYREIDVKGKHITPGIIDEHSHIGLWRGVNESGQASSAEVRIGDALNPSDINIYRQLSGGVTTSQLLHGSANPIGGQSAIIKLRWGRNYGDMFFAEASPFIKFALGENVKQTNWGDAQTKRFPQTRMGVEQVYYDYFYRAKEYGQLKKIAESSGKEKKKRNRKKKDETHSTFRRDLELDALLQILEKERFITCHSYIQSEINMLLHVADSMDFTLNTFTHILEGYKVADKMKAHGAAASTFSDWWAYKYEVNDAIPYNASLLTEMGVLTAINSDDAEMGRRLNQEAAKAIKYGGMSEEDALKMVTLNPAIMLHLDKHVGSITPGKHADIVIWSGHPLSVYSKADATYIDGIKYFDRSQAEEMEKRDNKERVEISNKMMEAIQGGSPAKKPVEKAHNHYHCDTIE